MKNNRIAVVLFTLSTLTACHHENPLKTNKPLKSAVFLAEASFQAVKDLKITSAPELEAGVYSDCMEDRIKHVNCPEFYKAMVDFAKTGKYPDFKNITVKDLTDEEVFLSLRDAYEEAVLFTRFKER